MRIYLMNPSRQSTLGRWVQYISTLFGSLYLDWLILINFLLQEFYTIKIGLFGKVDLDQIKINLLKENEYYMTTLHRSLSNKV